MTSAAQIELDQELLKAIMANNLLAVRDALRRGANPARLVDNPFLAGEQLLTGLHFASSRGSPEVLRMLLEAGALPNIEDPRGNTPLHASLGAGDPRANWRVLCEYGADPATANQRGVSARVAWERQFGSPPEEVDHAQVRNQQPSFTLPPPRPGFSEFDDD